MTKLDFPDTPSTGQQYGSSGTVWRWDGTRWASTAGAAGARGRVALARITALQGGITGTTIVPITGLSVTWTADPSRTYQISMVGTVQGTVAGDVASLLLYNGGTVVNHVNINVTPAGVPLMHGTQVQESGLSGVQTRSLSCQRAVGSGTLSMGGTAASPAFILVEDITYEAGATPPAIPPGARVGCSAVFPINMATDGAQVPWTMSAGYYGWSWAGAAPTLTCPVGADGVYSVAGALIYGGSPSGGIAFTDLYMAGKRFAVMHTNGGVGQFSGIAPLVAGEQIYVICHPGSNQPNTTAFLNCYRMST